MGPFFAPMHSLYCIIFSDQDQEKALEMYKDDIIDISGIPSIVDLNKEYEEFEILFDFKLDSDEKLLLVKNKSEYSYDVNIIMRREEKMRDFIVLAKHEMKIDGNSNVPPMNYLINKKKDFLINEEELMKLQEHLFIHIKRDIYDNLPMDAVEFIVEVLIPKYEVVEGIIYLDLNRVQSRIKN